MKDSLQHTTWVVFNIRVHSRHYLETYITVFYILTNVTGVLCFLFGKFQPTFVFFSKTEISMEFTSWQIRILQTFSFLGVVSFRSKSFVLYRKTQKYIDFDSWQIRFLQTFFICGCRRGFRSKSFVLDRKT